MLGRFDRCHLLLCLASICGGTRHTPSLTGQSLQERASRVTGLPFNFKAYYINLASSPDRKDRMERLLRQTSLPAERFEAVTRQRVASGEFDEHYIVPQTIDQGLLARAAEQADPGSLRNGTIGCYMSHVKLLEQIRDSLHPDDIVLILEDDVLVPSDWQVKIQAAVEQGPADWTMLKLSGWGWARTSDRVSPGWSMWHEVVKPVVGYMGVRFPSYSLYKTQSPQREPTKFGDMLYYAGTGGYLVKAKSVHSILEHLKSQPIDDLDKMYLQDFRQPTNDHRPYDLVPHIFVMGGGSMFTGLHGAVPVNGAPNSAEVAMVSSGRL